MSENALLQISARIAIPTSAIDIQTTRPRAARPAAQSGSDCNANTRAAISNSCENTSAAWMIDPAQQQRQKETSAHLVFAQLGVLDGIFFDRQAYSRVRSSSESLELS